MFWTKVVKSTTKEIIVDIIFNSKQWKYIGFHLYCKNSASSNSVRLVHTLTAYWFHLHPNLTEFSTVTLSGL